MCVCACVRACLCLCACLFVYSICINYFCWPYNLVYINCMLFLISYVHMLWVSTCYTYRCAVCLYFYVIAGNIVIDADLIQQSWSNINSYEDPSAAVQFFNDTFLSLLDKHAPLKKKRVKKCQQPGWMNQEIILADYRYHELSYKITSLISRTCCLGSSGLTYT